jgi:hypothetical protein
MKGAGLSRAHGTYNIGAIEVTMEFMNPISRRECMRSSLADVSGGVRMRCFTLYGLSTSLSSNPPACVYFAARPIAYEGV